MTRARSLLNTRLAAAQPSATYRMMDRAALRKAAGHPVVSLTAGEPDFDTPPHVREAGVQQAVGARHLRSTAMASNSLSCITSATERPALTAATMPSWRRLIFSPRASTSSIFSCGIKTVPQRSAMT